MNNDYTRFSNSARAFSENSKRQKEVEIKQQLEKQRIENREIERDIKTDRYNDESLKVARASIRLSKIAIWISIPALIVSIISIISVLVAFMKKG